MALKENLEFARQAVNYVKSFGIRPSNHPTSNRGRDGDGEGLKKTRDAARDFIREDEVRRLDGLPLVGERHRGLREIMHYAWAARANGFGNCMEQASLAFVYLLETRCRPIELMQFAAPQYDHTWVVIARTPGQDAALRTWGDDAVWCDPWQGMEGKYFGIQDFINERVSTFAPHSQRFHLHTPALVEAGLPRSYLRWNS